MAEFISNPESLSEQLVDIAEDKLARDPESCPICPELELIGVTDYLQLTIDNHYKVLYRYDGAMNTVLLQHLCEPGKVLKLLVQYAL